MNQMITEFESLLQSGTWTCYIQNCNQVTLLLVSTFKELEAFSNSSLISSLSVNSCSLLLIAERLCPVSMRVSLATGTHSTPVFGCFTVFNPNFSITNLRRSATFLNFTPLGLFFTSSVQSFRQIKAFTCQNPKIRPCFLDWDRRDRPNGWYESDRCNQPYLVGNCFLSIDR